jgi:hypothetical protein
MYIVMYVKYVTIKLQFAAYIQINNKTQVEQ